MKIFYRRRVISSRGSETRRRTRPAVDVIGILEQVNESSRIKSLIERIDSAQAARSISSNRAASLVTPNDDSCRVIYHPLLKRRGELGAQASALPLGE